MLAVIARFTRWIPPINFDEGSSVPLALVFQLADKLTPSDITDGFGQTVILDHVLDGQTLDANHLVFVDDACRKLVLVVAATVVDTGMNTGNLASGFLLVVSTFFLLGMPTLGFGQSLLIMGIELGVPDSLTCGEDHHRFEAQVQTDLGLCGWKRFDLLFHKHRDKVAIGTVLGDGDRAWLLPLGKGSVKGNGKGLIHLGKGELTIFPGEGVRGIGGVWVFPLFLKRRLPPLPSFWRKKTDSLTSLKSRMIKMSTRNGAHFRSNFDNGDQVRVLFRICGMSLPV